MAEFGVISTANVFDPTTSEESLLLARLNRVETNSTEYFAVHLHLSDLQRQNRQAHFVEIAA
jgi:hypothetical protein